VGDSREALVTGPDTGALLQQHRRAVHETGHESADQALQGVCRGAFMLQKTGKLFGDKLALHSHQGEDGSHYVE
jgi:transcriptional regulator GlxA family with amidase domain